MEVLVLAVVMRVVIVVVAVDQDVDADVDERLVVVLMVVPVFFVRVVVCSSVTSRSYRHRSSSGSSVKSECNSSNEEGEVGMVRKSIRESHPQPCNMT